ncbi:tumor necrosis factor receptor superfamily member 21-like isoform X1 [Branchiostoma lanceolatum]|uniref:tumor necrosis factor receptor superfamily member 21-like isoform X1 n=1 Tax=Branchiostoma lanceolatum TaxID=7740 RepID=UPI00345508E9
MRLRALRTCVLIVLLSGQQVEAPPKICNEITEYIHGELCCKKCPAGTYLKNDCLQDHGAPTCDICPPGTYTGFNNHLRGCLRCHIPCNTFFGFIETKTCQPYHNRQCRCEKGMYRVHEVCVLADRKPCPPGQGAVQKGTRRSNPVCEDCPPGTFSSKPSLTKACRTWRNCTAKGLETKTSGTSTKNAKCGGPLVPQQTKSVTTAIPVMPNATSEAATTTATTANPSKGVPTSKPPQTNPGKSTTAKVATEDDDTSLGQVPKDLDNSINNNNNNVNYQSQSSQVLLVVLVFIGVAILLIILIALVWKKVKKQRQRRKQNNPTPTQVHDGPAREQLLDPQDAQDGEGAGVGGQAPAEGQGQLEVAPRTGGVNVSAVHRHAGSPAADHQQLQPVDATMIQMQVAEGTTHVDARRQLVIYSQSTTIQQHNDFGSPNNVQVGQGNQINVGIENGVAEELDEE